VGVPEGAFEAVTVGADDPVGDPVGALEALTVGA